MRTRSICVMLICAIILASSTTTRAQDNTPIRSTPYPLPALEPITAKNAHRIEQLAFLGNGSISDQLYWTPDGQRLIAETTLLGGNYWVGPETITDGQYAWMVFDTFDPPTPPRLEYLPPSENCPAVDPAHHLIACGSFHRDEEYPDLSIWRTDEKLRATERIISINRSGRPNKFSPNGLWLLTSHDTRYGPTAYELFDVKTGASLLTIDTNTRDIHEFAFSPDSRWLAMLSRDDIHIFDTATIIETGTLTKPIMHIALPPDQSQTGITFSPNGSKLIFGSGLDVHVWDTANESEMTVLSGPLGMVHALAYSPDGSLIAAAKYADYGRETIHFWDATTYEHLASVETLYTGRTPGTYALAFNPTRPLLAYAVANSDRISLVDFSDLGRNGTVENVTPLQGFIGSGNMIRERDNQIATIKIGTDNILVIDLPSGHVIGEFFDPEYDRQYGLFGFGTATNTLIWLTHENKLRRWNFATGDVESLPLPFDLSQITALSIQANGGEIAYFDDALRLWNSATDDSRQILDGHVVAKLVFSPDGSRLAGWDGAEGISIWHVESTEMLTHIPIPGLIPDFAFSPDNQWLILATIKTMSVAVYDANDGHLITELPIPPFHEDTSWHANFWSLMSSVAFSPDRSILAVGGGWIDTNVSDGKIYLWDTETFELLTILSASPNPVSELVFGTDGTTLFSDGGNFFGPSARVWGVKTRP